MSMLTDRQVTAVKRVYDMCIWFLSAFYNTDGFNDYWFVFKKKGAANPEEDIYSLAERKLDRVRVVLAQEYFDLRNMDVYNDLCEYLNEDLVNLFDGKLGYAYRFEAIPNNNPTTDEDYEKAMFKLNAIIEKYV